MHATQYDERYSSARTAHRDVIAVDLVAASDNFVLDGVYRGAIQGSPISARRDVQLGSDLTQTYVRLFVSLAKKDKRLDRVTFSFSKVIYIGYDGC